MLNHRLIEVANQTYPAVGRGRGLGRSLMTCVCIGKYIKLVQQKKKERERAIYIPPMEVDGLSDVSGPNMDNIHDL